MFDLFVLQNTAQQRVREQFENRPRPPKPARSRKPSHPRRRASLTALRPSRAVADR